MNTAPKPLTLTLGLLASDQLRARLKYRRAEAPATSTSGVVKKSLEAERAARSSAGASAAARAAATSSSWLLGEASAVEGRVTRA